MKTLLMRTIHPEKWRPTGRDLADIHKYLSETVVALAEEVGDDECTVKAAKLLYDFCSQPFEKVKPAITQHFIDCYHSVDGNIECCYKDEELLRLIYVVLRPDQIPTKGA